jgi:hypothetical protein
MLGRNWSEMFASKNTKHPDLLKADEYAKKHIDTFLNIYGLSLDYAIEHKLEHTSSEIFYLKRAHYIMIPFHCDRSDERILRENVIYKIRGTNIRENPIYFQIAMREFLDTQEPQIYQLETISGRISTIHDYNVSLKNFYKDPKNAKIILPGYNIRETKIFRFNSLDLPYKDFKDYQKRHSVKGDIDYGHLLNEISFQKLFERRLDDYENRT